MALLVYLASSRVHVMQILEHSYAARIVPLLQDTRYGTQIHSWKEIRIRLMRDGSLTKESYETCE